MSENEKAEINGGVNGSESKLSQWIPIPNDKLLYISSCARLLSLDNGFCPFACTGMFVGKYCNNSQASKNVFTVLIHDRIQGEISYKTKMVEIEGVDIRVSGNQIEYVDSLIEVVPIRGRDEKYALIKGRRLSVKNVCTTEIEAIKILVDEKIDIQLHDKRQIAERCNGRAKLSFGWGAFLAFIGCLCFLMFLSLMPFGEFDTICTKYSKALYGVSNTNKVTSVGCACEPPVVTNTLSVLTSCNGVTNQNLQTNIINTATTSVSSVAGSQVQLKGNESSGTLGVTFCFVLICFLYVGLYGVFVYLTLVAFHAWRRHRKLNGGISSVLNALRAETDKKKRQEMRDKILDDMIDTYLDKPSSED